MNVVEMLVFVAYFLFMLGIGVFFFLKSRTPARRTIFWEAGTWVPGCPPCLPVPPT